MMIAIIIIIVIITLTILTIIIMIITIIIMIIVKQRRGRPPDPPGARPRWARDGAPPRRSGGTAETLDFYPKAPNVPLQ